MLWVELDAVYNDYDATRTTAVDTRYHTNNDGGHTQGTAKLLLNAWMHSFMADGASRSKKNPAMKNQRKKQRCLKNE